MKRKMNDLVDDKIDRIEQQVLKARVRDPEELRAIVSGSQFLDRINAGINAAQRGRNPRHKSIYRMILPDWDLTRVVVVFGGLALISVCTLSMIFYLDQDSLVPRLVDEASLQEIQQSITSSKNLEPPPNDNAFKMVKAEEPAGKNRLHPKKIAFRNKVRKSMIHLPRTFSARKLPSAENETESVFYPLAFGGSLEEAKKVGQIIRVEMNRSSLLALGLNPPAENEAHKFTTDLLISSDGIASGIRFVRQ